MQAAQDDLANAALRAPISGTVGTVGLTAGSASGSGSVVIVGDGNAQVTFELPLKTRTLVTSGQQVSVTPAGSTTSLEGTLTTISAVETSGTAGDTPTYAATVTVSDPDQLLASGAKASVSLPVKSATNVVRVPVSAVTPTGTDTGTVQIVGDARADSATLTNVTTGAVGGGWIEITDGVKAGDLVVLADNTAELPANSTGRRSSSQSSASASASAQPAASSAPSAAPSASPSR
ncbi:MAG: HlyD family efflux transporter periplasmic adaptor subunit [Micropruina sp.]|uniref:efflux RND transporter periplasmic adaptor subunit n=1 Tax=Micropruina sp. TaxID=2737536 RepID=UPI0039E45AA3